MIKKLHLDLETTGTNKWEHGVRQISALVEIPGEPLVVFDARINLPVKYKWDPYVLENMATPEEYANDEEMYEVFMAFKKLLEEYINPYDKKDKFFLYGYNVKFDADFLRQFFFDNGDKWFGSWFHVPPIDVMALAAEYLIEERHEMENFKLMTVAKQLNIKVNEEKLHDSLYDIELTKTIYEKVKNNEQIK